MLFPGQMARIRLEINVHRADRHAAHSTKKKLYDHCFDLDVGHSKIIEDYMFTVLAVLKKLATILKERRLYVQISTLLTVSRHSKCTTLSQKDCYICTVMIISNIDIHFVDFYDNIKSIKILDLTNVLISLYIMHGTQLEYDK